jgi:hypothetical protein
MSLVAKSPFHSLTLRSANSSKSVIAWLRHLRNRIVDSQSEGTDNELPSEEAL